MLNSRVLLIFRITIRMISLKVKGVSTTFDLADEWLNSFRLFSVDGVWTPIAPSKYLLPVKTPSVYVIFTVIKISSKSHFHTFPLV